VAAPDFYFAVNATFRWIHDNWGEEGLLTYWRSLGREHYAPLAARVQCEGLPALRRHWEAFFADEPGAVVEVLETPHSVTLEVNVCPAFKHLREAGRDIVPFYCRHCTEVTGAMLEPAGMQVVVEGGDGSCRQTFTMRGEAE
jgi:hypothetical protein